MGGQAGIGMSPEGPLQETCCPPRVPPLSALTLPPFCMLTNFPAIKEILPPSPFPNVFVDTALFDPVINMESVAVKFTLPPLPKPTEGCPLATATLPLWLRICAPSCRVKLPTFPTIWPALPSQRVEESILVPAFMTTDGVVTDICPQ